MKNIVYNVRIRIVKNKPYIGFVYSLRKYKKGYKWTPITGKKLSNMIKVPLSK